MKRMNFLAKLYKEKKLQIVESSEELKKSYINKSESNLASAKILLENDRLEESIALTYYSMYHLLTALLFKTGIKCENHAAAIILLKKVFDIDNSDIASAKKERVDKQYYINFNITENEVIEAIKKAEESNSNLFNFISKLEIIKINEYRDKFKSLIQE